MTPPGTRLRALAARLCGAITMERLVDPAIADLQAEYEEASRTGPGWRRRWIWMRGHIAFFTMMVVHSSARREASAASEPRDRSEAAKRRARARVGEFEGRSPSVSFGTATGIRTPVPWLRNAAGDTMVSGCVGFPRDFARTLGRCPVERAGFVRKVSSFFQEQTKVARTDNVGERPQTKGNSLDEGHLAIWLGGRDSNPDNVVQSHVSYR